MALGRLQDELAVLAQRCKDEGLRLDWAVVRRVYAEPLGQFMPVSMGRPKKGATHVERRRFVMFIDRSLLEWVQQRTPDLFNDADPVGHAVDSSLRNLRSAEDPEAIRSAAFPFDAGALWRRYKAAR